MSGPDEEEKSAVIIPWPGKRIQDVGPVSPASAAGSDPDDAFDAALRRASREPIPGAPEAVSAEALAARVVSAVTGLDDRAARDAVREATHNVIDLDEARAAREAAGAASSERLKEAIRAAFTGFMHEVAEPGKDGGRPEVVIDGRFLREHGTAFMATLFKTLAGAVTQARPNGNESTQPTRAEPLPLPQGPAVRVDLGDILGSLFRRKP